MAEKIQGIFTTIQFFFGKPLFLKQHLQRLLHGKGRKERETYKKIIREKLKMIQDTCALRIDLFDTGEIGFSTRSLPKIGSIIRAATIEITSLLPKVKQIDRLLYDKADALARKKNADIAIFKKSGFLLESTRSTIVSVDKTGSIITPPLKNEGINGIARQVLLKRGYLKKKRISVQTLGPIILINSLRIEGMSHVDGRKLSDPKPLMRKVGKMLYENTYSR